MPAVPGLTASLDPDGIGMTPEEVNLYLATIELTSAQARTLCDIIPPTDQMDSRWWYEAPTQLADAIRARAEEPHHAERWGADHAELAALCENLPPAHAVALVDAIVRARTAHADLDEALREVRLLT
ncbi:hypothetical protein A5780_32430 [Nocardia sp. 852002-20019_SCH5090214]|uniref:hypothetical protein n=1 Tax=Nocardia TaxID=1817 RepID=UPI0007A4FC00|nr:MULTISPECIES: hypothetical protein [Nocardia]MCC3311405.1 hypothetical protein [Nocardia africana]OBA49232.1 hypothetical protein A5780_32430 [Nocardia sp. 852002-20019_SCH5090214]